MEMNLDDRPGCFGFAIQWFRGLLPAKDVVPQRLPYRLTDQFLSPAEFTYYKILGQVLGSKAAICPKVRLQDLLFVVTKRKNFIYFNKIRQKHIDFLICDAEKMQPFFAIELDDSSHQRADRMERDRFLDAAFEAAGFPLIHIPVKFQYSQQEVFNQLKIALSKKRVGQPVSQAHEEPEGSFPGVEAAARPPLCPKCGVPMVLRVASKGEHKGQQFYGCVNYPQCHELKSVG